MIGSSKSVCLSGLTIGSLIFRANRLFFVSKRAICSWKRVIHSQPLFCKANCSCRSLKKSKGAKSDWRKRGKAVKNTWKIYLKNWANWLFFESDSLESQANHSCCSLKKSDKEQIAHGRSLKWAILSKRVKSKERKSERANFEPWCLLSTPAKVMVPN